MVIAVLFGGLPATASGGTGQPVPLTPGFAPIRYWNSVLLDTFRQVGGAPGPLARAAAIMHTAIYEAVNSADGAVNFAPYHARIPVSGRPSWSTAIAYAAYRTLRALYPAINFDDELTFALSQRPSPDDDPVLGEQLGTEAANIMLRIRAGDGSTDTTPYQPGTQPGDWRPTGPEPPATPNWGRVRPFCINVGYRFRPPLPGGATSKAQLLASQLYADQVNEVRALGAVNSTSRTADQTTAAFFWANDVDGTYKPPGQLLEHTAIVAVVRPQHILLEARMFALVSLALADAAIVAWDAKYLTDVDLWRPETAIQLADTDGNPGTQPDRSWRPLSRDRAGNSFSPPFPAYISGHATLAGAWARMIALATTTRGVPFTATTDDPNAVGVRRTFTTFEAAAIENAYSRVWLGVHFRFDADAGLAAGRALADFIYLNFLYSEL